MNSNLKRFFCYLIYVIAVGFIVIMADDYHQYLKQLYTTTFKFSIKLWLFPSILATLVGILLALPQFITTFKQKGNWKVDWIKLLTVGLPSLCIVISPIFARVQFTPTNKIIFFTVGLHPSLVTVAGILFGFVLVTSFRKQESESTA